MVTDLSNILLCMFTLLPTICNDADEFLGRKVTTNIIRNIHVKCHLLLTYFLIRGTPLSVLYKVNKIPLINCSHKANIILDLRNKSHYQKSVLHP